MAPRSVVHLDRMTPINESQCCALFAEIQLVDGENSVLARWSLCHPFYFLCAITD